MSPSPSSSTSTATCASRSRIGSFATRNEPRTPSSRHSSSPGGNSRGCATRSASDHGSIGCSSTPVTRSCAGIGAGAPGSGSCRSTDRADPTPPSRSTTATRSTARSRALTPEQRAVFVLHHHAGHPLAEIADIVGVPVGTVKSRLHYATRTLRAAIVADEPGRYPRRHDRHDDARAIPTTILAAWLDEGPTRLPDPTRRAIVVALPTNPRQTGTPWACRGGSRHDHASKLAIGAVAVVAILARRRVPIWDPAAGRQRRRRRRRLATPDARPPRPHRRPRRRPPTPAHRHSDMDARSRRQPTMTITHPVPVHVTVTVPDGWPADVGRRRMPCSVQRTSGPGRSQSDDLRRTSTSAHAER